MNSARLPVSPLNNSILVLSGPPGAGKSTVAGALVPLLPAPVAKVEGDAFWPFFARTENLERHVQFRTSMRAMSAAAIAFARDGYATILDFSIPPRSLDVARKRLKDSAITLHYVVLLPSVEVCVKRAAERRTGAIEDSKDYREFYESFITDEFEAIEDDDAPIDVIATRIHQGWREGRFRVT
jgi:adenylate kinase family enzyme